MAIDPVCGMEVAEDAPLQHRFEGVTYRFCSEHCLHRFRDHPHRYLKQGAAPAAPAAGIHTCPMHPEVRQQGPGACPKCGMALEPVNPPAAAPKTEYTCPMHPEVVQDHPGTCPKCGMALEPRTVAAEEDNAELRDMSRRFRVSAALALPILISAMGAEMWPEAVGEIIAPRSRQWLELLLATPVVLWGGWPFFVRGWRSLLTRNLNMFTLIALGVGVAWVYSMVAVLAPGIFPHSVFHMGVVPVYFEAA
ncbi:MAG: heavy metal-binding domain-containing protein, partial [Thiobacillus sp.]|nr:heavy metal-binding domain-containing protein [Thiobacillus sp.]